MSARACVHGGEGAHVHGLIMFTRTPDLSVPVMRSVRNSPTTPCLATQYSGWPTRGMTPAMLETSRRQRSRGPAAAGPSTAHAALPGLRARYASARWLVYMTPVRLTSTVRMAGGGGTAASAAARV